MIEIIGKNEVKGEVSISGSKNAALPIICASLLTRGIVELTNVPKISDVLDLIDILKELNVKITFNSKKMIIDSRNIKNKILNSDSVKRIRASSYLIGVLLALFKKADIAFPGGCNLGDRNLDFHFKAILDLGGDVEIEKDMIHAQIKDVKGGGIIFERKSVGATINAMILCGMSKFTTKIYRYAKEPEVKHLSYFLKKIGYSIYEMGDYMLVAGHHRLKRKVKYKIPYDRIEAASYLFLGVKSKGLIINNAPINDMDAIFDALTKMGANYKIKKKKIYISNSIIKGIDVFARSYPGFPTDCQPLIAALLLQAESDSFIADDIYKNRFNYIKGLAAMDGIISREEGIMIKPSHLFGAVVKGYDLRGVFSLIIAATYANGKTTILDGDLAYRGYENLIEKLNNIGIKAKEI